ncbi:MAG: rRNA maturation RNase YbeY [Zetaproteobacteria bacterium]|nr:MAG: rRNA maturation RNase YbeY [Zetaproteobacteria bacterium]
MIDWQIDPDVPSQSWPDPARIETVVRATLASAGLAHPEQASITIRVVSDETMRALNLQWRKKDDVTDVISFPMQQGPTFSTDEYLGDIALGFPFIALEAERLGLDLDSHLQHLLVHATLHLIGFDHAEPEERRRMQQKEKTIMAGLGLHDPYNTWCQQDS